MLTFDEIVKYSKNILPHCNMCYTTENIKLYLTDYLKIRYYCDFHYENFITHENGRSARKLTAQEQFVFKIIEK